MLALKYKIAVGWNLFDTMISNHRIYPLIEKSLGHCISLHTWLPFHKDEGGGGYATDNQMINMLRYCGKDVYSMVIVHKKQMLHAAKIPGMTESIEQAMQSLYPYITTTLHGMLYDEEMVIEKIVENDQMMMQYLRCIKLLVGEDTLKKIRRSSKKGMPGSNSQCVAYFHDELGYPVVARSKKTKKPSLDEKAMYKLALKHYNPVIDFVLAYRRLSKETGSLKFTPWSIDCLTCERQK